MHAALQPLGRVAGICVYGNATTFAWVPPFERRRRRALADGSAGLVSSCSRLTICMHAQTPLTLMHACSWTEGLPEGEADDALRCGVCGVRTQTPAKLALHFRQELLGCACMGPCCMLRAVTFYHPGCHAAQAAACAADGEACVACAQLPALACSLCAQGCAPRRRAGHAAGAGQGLCAAPHPAAAGHCGAHSLHLCFQPFLE